MGFKDTLIELQNMRRDHGWRIKMIPWWDVTKLHKMYSSWLTLCLGFGGALCFIGGLFLIAGVESGQFSFKVPLAVSLGGLLAALMSNFVGAFQKYSGWVKVESHVVDREIREIEVVVSRRPGSVSLLRNKTRWFFRFICEFHFDGQSYKVTPDHNFCFKSEQKLLDFLDRYVDEPQVAELWVNPKNPLETVFLKKPRMLRNK